MPSSACDWSSDVCSSDRSEEHTSELQSRSDLVCRLLLEKKKKNAELNARTQTISRLIVAETGSTSADTDWVCSLDLAGTQSLHRYGVAAARGHSVSCSTC